MPSWQKIEAYNQRVKNKSIAVLSKTEVREYTELYRLAGLQLAYARTHYASSKATAYLNQLTGVSHNAFYTKESSAFGDVVHYYKVTFPNELRKHKNYFFTALCTFLVGAALCFVLALVDSQYLYFFLPQSQLQQADFSHTARDFDYPMISAFIMSNNIRVSFMAFVSGALAGLGTLFVLFYNGAIIGALTSYVAMSGGSMANYLALILPHGFIELTAIFISGAAGLLVGKAILIPNDMTRMHAVVKNTKEAALLIPGVVGMLIIAGVIEGFFTPMAIPVAAKLAFAGVTLLCLFAYFLLAGRSTQPDIND